MAARDVRTVIFVTCRVIGLPRDVDDLLAHAHGEPVDEELTRH
jgi:hypothetical protein